MTKHRSLVVGARVRFTALSGSIAALLGTGGVVRAMCRPVKRGTVVFVEPDALELLLQLRSSRMFRSHSRHIPHGWVRVSVHDLTVE
jgi:hypothetical protein